MPKKNAKEIDTARRALERLAELCVEVHWSHVRAHRGHFLNELADLAAKLALGTSCTAESTAHTLQSLAPVPLRSAIIRHLHIAGNMVIDSSGL